MSQGRTSNGHVYEVGQGVTDGLPCDGLITPNISMAQMQSKKFDVIIIGAGYTGLTAARDLTIAGLHVLLLEGRDRIGGRTWTSRVDDHLYEMGGTWIHWGQPHAYREMVRYNLHRDFIMSEDVTNEPRTVIIDDDGQRQQVTLETYYRLADKAFKTFFNVDGEFGKTILPFPHDSLRNPAARAIESLSATQRLEQVQGSLTKLEFLIVKGLIEGCAGNKDFNKVGFFDVLRWWALSGFTTDSLFDYMERYKIKEGQTHFALQFFNEALQTQKLSYIFKAPVTSVVDKQGCVTATLRDGRQFRGRRMISTLPLNVMRDVKFDPPLSKARDEAARIGHVHIGSKVHIKVDASETRPCSVLAYSKSRIVNIVGDGQSERDGSRHMVAFGRNDASLSPADDAASYYDQTREYFPDMPISKIVWHDWSRDEFSKGAWCMYYPGFTFKYLEALRQRAGNILFANADWALGWRGFIDGAIEEGTRVAFEITSERAAAFTPRTNL